MGADGGICWMKLCDPSKYERVLELLRPFYFLTYIDDYHRSNIEWSDPIIGGPDFLIGTYGTDQEWSIDEDLTRVLDPESFDSEFDYDPSIQYSNLTFMELVDDLVTRPLSDGADPKWHYIADLHAGARLHWDVNCKHISLLEVMLWDVVQYYFKDENALREQLRPIGDMKVGEWFEELRSWLDYKHHGCEETWT